MARISQDARWAVPNGDFAALWLTSEVFFARCGIRIQARNGGVIVGGQGSTLASCLCLLRFAPVRLLPKRARIGVVQGAGGVVVQAHFEDNFLLPVIGRFLARRYEEQFSEWLDQLEGHVEVQARLEDSLLARRAQGVVSRYQRSSLTWRAAANEIAVAYSIREQSNGTTSHEISEVDTLRDASPSIAAGTLENSEHDSFEAVSPLEEAGVSESSTLQQAATTEDSTEAWKTAEEPMAEFAGTASTAADVPADEPAASDVSAAQPQETEETSEEPIQSAPPPHAEPSAQESVEAGESPDDQTAKVGGDSPSPKRGDETTAAQREGRPRLGLSLPRFGFANRPNSIEESQTVGLAPEVGFEITQGDALLEAGALTDSIQHYDSALAAVVRKPEAGTTESATVAQIHLRRGLAHFRQNHAHFDAAGQSEKSATDFRAALDSTRNKVIADYDEAIRLNPNLANAFFRRGEAHLFTARCERGSRRFRQASQELSHAVIDLSRATELNPSFAAAFALRAIAHSLLQHEEEVEADVGKAIALGADSVMVWRAIWASKSWGPQA